MSNLTFDDEITLYAVWTENDKVSPVIFTPTVKDVDYGDTVTLVSNTSGAEIHYTTNGNEPTVYSAIYESPIEIISDTTIKAIAVKSGMRESDVSTADYTIKNYTVTFSSEYSTAPAQITGLRKGDILTASQLPELSKTGYTFDGWYYSGTKINAGYEITCSIELTAKWLEMYTITYELNDGTNAAENPSNYTVETATITLKNPTKTGYTFDGWYKESSFATKVTEIIKGSSNNITLYAKWTVNKYTITYNLNGGTNAAENPSNYTVETATITLKNPTKTGYTFSGWYKESSFATKVTEITKGSTGNITLYAKWNANKYNVTFDSNGGSGNMATQTFTYGTAQALTANTFTRTGYVFVGWATSDAGNAVYQNNENFLIGTKDVTLYAKWDSEGFVFVKGATITGKIANSKVFIDGRTVTISSFYMCDREVTQAEYWSIVGSLPSNMATTDGNSDNNPVNCISWYDAIVYCNKRSMEEGLTPCYSISNSTDPAKWGTVPTSWGTGNSTWGVAICDFTANGYRLPTEAEWEYAARGGNGLTGTQYTYAGSDTIGEVAWYTDNSGRTTHEVKTKKANSLGLYDMSGNVWEWCWDWSSSISGSTLATGSASGSSRCQHGGSWNDYGRNCVSYCQVAFRSSNSPYSRCNNCGFRLVRSAR